MTVMIWPRGGVDLVVGADGGRWAGVTASDLSELAGNTGPLRRLLLMLGYEVDHLFAQAETGDVWARMDLLTLEATGVSGADGPGTVMTGLSPGPVLALPIPAYVDARADGATPVALGMPLPGRPGLWTADTEAGYLLLFGIFDQEAGPPAVPGAFFDVLDVVIDALLDGVADDLEDAVPEPSPGSGLFWLADPGTWFADPEAMRGSQAYRELESVALLARDVVTGSLGEDGTPLLSFLTEQVTLVATPHLDPPLPFLGARRRLPTLKRLLRWTPEGGMFTSRHADRFFTSLGVWLAERRQEGVLPGAELDELRDAPWFQVIATLVDRGIVAPPALASSVDGEAEEEPPPVVAERVDSATVDLTVHQTLTIRLTLVRDADGAVVAGTEPPGEDKTLLAPIREFTWDYLVPADESELPGLVIVAAPGVDLQVPRTPVPSGWWLQIIRVQDAALVPDWGTAVDPGRLLAPYLISPTDTYGGGFTLPGQQETAPLVHVRPRPDGVTLSYPSGSADFVQELQRVDITLGADPAAGGLGTGALYSGEVRFAFDVVFHLDDRGLLLPDPVPHIVVWVTDDVTVEVTVTALTELRDLRLHPEVWRVPDYTDIPAFGERLPFDTSRVEHFTGFAPGWEQPWTADEGGTPGRTFTALHVERTSVVLTPWFTTVLDVIVGAIPVVGDVVDIADFALALSTGHDKWGSPVSGGQLMMMGACALLPIASGSLAEGLGRVIPGLPPPALAPPLRLPAGATARGTGEGVRSFAQRVLRPAGASAADARRLAGRAKSFDQLTAQEQADVIAELRRFIGDHATEFARASVGQVLSPDDILDATGAGIRVPEVMREYGRWRADRIRASPPTGPMEELSVDAFFADVKAPRTRAILEVLCGNRAVGTALEALHRSVSAAQRWKSTGFVVLRKSKPARTWLRDQIRRGALVSQVDAVMAARTGQDAAQGGLIWVDQLYLARSELARRSTQTYGEYVARLLDGLSGGRPQAITLDALGTLIGRRLSFYPGELAQLLVIALDVAGHELARSGRTLDDVLQASGARRRIEGITGFFHGLVTSKGKEQGARFEVFLAGDEISQAPNVFIRMGARLPGVLDTVRREGPDLLRYIGVSARVADIIQGKAYASMRPLFSNIPIRQWFRAGQEWRGPEVFRQLVSDIVRMAKTDPPFMLESLTGTGKVGFTGGFEFAIDFRHYLTSAVAPTVDAAEIDRLARLDVEQILDEFSIVPGEPGASVLDVEALLPVIDDLKGVKTETEIMELLDAVRPAIEGQLQEFLDLPDLATVLGITIPDGMRLTIEVTFR